MVDTIKAIIVSTILGVIVYYTLLANNGVLIELFKITITKE